MIPIVAGIGGLIFAALAVGVLALILIPKKTPQPDVRAARVVPGDPTELGARFADAIESQARALAMSREVAGLIDERSKAIKPAWQASNPPKA